MFVYYYKTLWAQLPTSFVVQNNDNKNYYIYSLSKKNDI